MIGVKRARPTKASLSYGSLPLSVGGIAAAINGGAVHAQAPPVVTPFADSLEESSLTSTAGKSGTYTASSTIYATNTITTAASTIDGNAFNTASHTWTSINDSYVSSGMTAPAFTGLTAFGKDDFGTTAAASNSDGKTGSKFLYTGFTSDQPSQPAGTEYGVQSVYLVSPLITVQNGTVITFWTKGDVDTFGAAGGDQLKLLFSASSSSTFNIGGYAVFGTNTGTSGGQATYDQGDFTKPLIDINPGYLADGSATGAYPTSWTEYSVTMSGLTTSTNNPAGALTGRFAFQYLETHANPYASDGFGNDIAIDDFTAGEPEPSALALVISGVPLTGGIAILRRRRKRS